MKKIMKEFGKYVVEMRNFREIEGHDDSLPYKAELFVNGKKIAECHNDGWGGDTMITPIDINLFNQVAEVVCSTNGLFGHEDWNYTIPSLADELAFKYNEELFIEKEQANKLLFKSKDGLIYASTIKSSSRSCVPIAELILSKAGQDKIKEIVKKYEGKGYTLLNRNIKYRNF